MVNTYLYTGPLPLGSVVAHNCGAAGLFSDKVDPDIILEACQKKKLSEDLGEAMVGINENEIQILMAERGK